VTALLIKRKCVQQCKEVQNELVTVDYENKLQGTRKDHSKYQAAMSVPECDCNTCDKPLDIGIMQNCDLFW
jgi:hypothetical protein